MNWLPVSAVMVDSLQMLRVDQFLTGMVVKLHVFRCSPLSSINVKTCLTIFYLTCDTLWHNLC